MAHSKLKPEASAKKYVTDVQFEATVFVTIVRLLTGLLTW